MVIKLSNRDKRRVKAMAKSMLAYCMETPNVRYYLQISAENEVSFSQVGHTGNLILMYAEYKPLGADSRGNYPIPAKFYAETFWKALGMTRLVDTRAWVAHVVPDAKYTDDIFIS